MISIVPEIPAERYRREAAACRLRAEETANSVDKEAWLKLGDDWDKLARERGRDDDVAMASR